MSSVDQITRRLVEVSERFSKDPRSIVKHHIREVIPEGIPFWVPPTLREKLLKWGFKPQVPVHGNALGVVASGQGAFLVRLSVTIEHEQAGTEAVLPVCLSVETATSLREAARVALSQYPHFRPLDIRNHLRFRVLDLMGHELNLAEQIEGRSLGLAAAVATWSALAQAPMPDDMVFTGALSVSGMGRESSIEGVAHIAAKNRAVLEAGARLVLPVSNAAELGAGQQFFAVSNVAEALRSALGPEWRSPQRCRPPPARDITADLEWWDMQYRHNADPKRWPEFAEHFDGFLRSSSLPDSKRLFALGRAIACWTHSDRLQEANLAPLRQLLEDLDPNEVGGADEVAARTHLANAYRDGYCFELALPQAELAWKLGESLRLHGEKMKARSTLGQILVAMGRVEEGLPHLQAALEHFEKRNPSECSRNHCYRLEALGRAGRFEEAEQEYRLGRQHAEERVIDEKHRRPQMAFLDYARLNGWLRRARRSKDRAAWGRMRTEAERALEGLQGDWPRYGLERIRDVATLRDVAHATQREAVLAQSAERFCLSPGKLLGWHCGLVFLEAAFAELEWGGELAQAKEWLRTGLRTVPYRSAWRFLRAGRALHAPSSSALRDAILVIVETEQY